MNHSEVRGNFNVIENALATSGGGCFGTVFVGTGDISGEVDVEGTGCIPVGVQNSTIGGLDLDNVGAVQLIGNIINGSANVSMAASCLNVDNTVIDDDDSDSDDNGGTGGTGAIIVGCPAAL